MSKNKPLSVNPAVVPDDVESPSVPMERTRSMPPKNYVSNPGGRNVHTNKSLSEFSGKPLERRHQMARDTWVDTAYVLATRAKSIAKRAGKLDYNLLYRLILSAGIAYDKAFPRAEVPSGSNVVVQLFGSLGNSTVRTILQPDTPSISTDRRDTIVDVPSVDALDETT